MRTGSHEAYLRQAIELAFAARSRGNHPFGALIVFAGGEVLQGVNSVVSEQNNTRHAEINALNAAAGRQAMLREATIYASTEPCAMCAGAIFWAGIRRVVYGCSAVRLGTYTGGSLIVPCRDIFARGKCPTEVTGPLLEDAAAAVHADFWQRRLPVPM